MESGLKVKGAAFILFSLLSSSKGGLKIILHPLKLIGQFKTILGLETKTSHWVGK